MADRIVVMNGGRIEQVGTPLELYDRPANRFVAGFIGSPAMAFLDARYRRTAGGAELVLTDDTVLQVPPLAAEDGAELSVGIRPERYRLDAEGPLSQVVEVVEPTGPETHVVGRIAGTEVRCVFRERLSPRPGDVLRLSALPEDMHVFAAASSARLN